MRVRLARCLIRRCGGPQRRIRQRVGLCSSRQQRPAAPGRGARFHWAKPLGYNSGVRQSALVRAQRIIVFIIVAALAGIALLALPFSGSSPFGGGAGSDGSAWNGIFAQGSLRAANRQIALVSGHAGNDSGAVCEDAAGAVTLTEAAVNAAVVERTAATLRSAGASVTILDEFDPRLDGLQADLFLSIHADSCVDASGYKAASHALRSSLDDARLLACIDHYYHAATALPHHTNTVTHNMTEYHAFAKLAPETPAAILELGFLGGDRTLLETQPDRVAHGVAESLFCFLSGADPRVAPTATVAPLAP